MIRDATHDDADALIEMGKAFFDEAGLPERFAALGLPDVAFCPQSFLTSCEAMGSGLGVMLVAEVDGEVVGMLGAVFAPAPWNFAVALGHEAWWYVRADRRKGAGVALMKEFEARAAARGVLISGMVAEHSLRGKTVGMLYQAKGYAPAETIYWKRLGQVH